MASQSSQTADSTPEVSITRYDRDAVAIRMEIGTLDIAMMCPLGVRDFHEHLQRLRGALSSGDPKQLETCTDLLVSVSGNTVTVQCGTFSVLSSAYRLASGLKVSIPYKTWIQALRAGLAALDEKPLPL